jgi:hypothetical protein
MEKPNPAGSADARSGEEMGNGKWQMGKAKLLY